MIELKAIHAYTFDEVEVISTHSNGNDYYLKSEADEELAKLNRQVKFLQTTHSSCNECNKCADGMGRVFDEYLDELKKDKAYLLEHTTEVINSQERVIHRQKYKRCMAMAEKCKESLILMRLYEVTDEYWNLEPGQDAEYFCKKGDFYSTWRKRWLKLAEQFKDDK